MYIYENENWPFFTWDNKALFLSLSQVRNMQGKLIGRMEAIGFDLAREAAFENLSSEVLKTSEIEGEYLDLEQVRSSVAHRMGLDFVGKTISDRRIDGIVDMMMDATVNFNEPLSFERLFSWHSSLFPLGRNSLHDIITGDWRRDETGRMRVISGIAGEEKVHFVGPPASQIFGEMEKFVHWFNANSQIEPVIKAGLAHLWFVTIHPFDDGNGRIARALTEMLLTRSDGSPQRFYTMSSRIIAERKRYYEMLETTQKGGMDVTEWLLWFLECLSECLNSAFSSSSQVLCKAQFWKQHTGIIFNARQNLMLNKLLNGFKGNLSSSKWAKICKCSQDTALRDIQDLINKGILKKTDSGGRSTCYELVAED
jgi:Fic family protein